MTKMMIAAAVFGSFFASAALAESPKYGAYYGDEATVRVETLNPQTSLDMVAFLTENDQARDETAALPDDVGTQLAGLFNPRTLVDEPVYMRDRYGRRYMATTCPFERGIAEDHVGCAGRMWELVGVYASLDYSDHSFATYSKAKAVMFQMPRLLAEYEEQLQGLGDVERAGLEAEIAEVRSMMKGLTAKLATWRLTVKANGGWDVLADSEPLLMLREAQLATN